MNRNRNIFTLLLIVAALIVFAPGQVSVLVGGLRLEGNHFH